MKRSGLLLSLVFAGLLSGGCEQAPQPGAQAAPPAIPVVSIATPAPPLQVLKASEAEIPPPPPISRGKAAPPTKTKQESPPPSAGPQPVVDIGHDYPKAKNRSRTRAGVVSYNPPPTYRVPNYRPGPPVSPAAPSTYPTAGSRPTIPIQPRRQPPPPQYYQSYTPPAYHHPTPYQPHQPYPRANGQVQVQAHQQWQQQKRLAKQEYLQARADALNHKYGTTHFTAHSPEVMLSASAPPSVRPQPRAPWDTLGQAFDRSEVKRQQWQAVEQARPGIPAAPGHPQGFPRGF